MCMILINKELQFFKKTLQSLILSSCALKCESIEHLIFKHTHPYEIFGPFHKSHVRRKVASSKLSRGSCQEETYALSFVFFFPPVKVTLKV